MVSVVSVVSAVPVTSTVSVEAVKPIEAVEAVVSAVSSVSAVFERIRVRVFYGGFAHYNGSTYTQIRFYAHSCVLRDIRIKKRPKDAEGHRRTPKIP